MKPSISQKKLVVHIFIQWLAHNNLLNEWLDEMNNESLEAGFFTDDRANRIINSNNQYRLVSISFSFPRSIHGEHYWRQHQEKWENVYFDLPSIMVTT